MAGDHGDRTQDDGTPGDGTQGHGTQWDGTQGHGARGDGTQEDSTQWETDDALFLALREAVNAPDAWPDGRTSVQPGITADPRVMERMRQAASVAFTWRTVDAELELLALSYDSLLDPATLVRGEAAPGRTIVFESESFTMCVEVGAEVLTGQLVPARPGHLTLLSPAGWCGETESDDAGFFLLARPAPGPVRLRCRTGQDGLVTDWVVL